MVQQYAETFEESRSNPDRLNAHVDIPKVGWSVKVVVAPTEEQADATARQAFATWREHISYLERRAKLPPRADRGGYDFHRENGSLLVGSPEQVAEEMNETVEGTGVNYLLCSFAFGALPHSDAMRSMELFSERVMPQFVQPAPEQTPAG